MDDGTAEANWEALKVCVVAAAEESSSCSLVYTLVK